MGEWCERAWLDGVKAQPKSLRVFAERLAGHANPLGEVTASQGFLRKALGFKTLDADMLFRQLRELGAVEKVRGGRQGQPSVWALTYTATPVQVMHAKNAANHDDDR